MKKQFRLSAAARNLFAAGAICALLPVTANSAEPIKKGRHNNVDYVKIISLVPDKDPVGKKVSFRPEIAGKHPRLLFDSTFGEKMRQLSETDPELKKARENLRFFASKKNRIVRSDKIPQISENDSTALGIGFWTFPAFAFSYAMDPNPDTLENISNLLENMADTEYWVDGPELECNMGCANNIFLVALLYDAAYNDLKPEVRKKVEDALLKHTRRMYYLGYKMLIPNVPRYWQNDPQNNHRIHRGTGQISALAAIADKVDGKADFLLGEARKELDFLMKYFPADGDCHEGSEYQGMAFPYLAIQAMISDRNFGTEYLQHPGFKNAWKQQLYYWVPGRNGLMSFGDSSNGEGGLGTPAMSFVLSARLSQNPDVIAAFNRYLRFRMGDPKRFSYPWGFLLGYEYNLPGGDYSKISPLCLLEDLGAAAFRNSWESDAALFTFKCGPYGGIRLNEFRHENPDEKGNPHYINVAHDDPDANSFALALDGEFVFHPGNYSMPKYTFNANTVLFNGLGQYQEGQGFTQPKPGVDMREMAYITAYKTTPDNCAVIEGEAGKSYPDFESFRRTTVWAPGKYILILDRVKAVKSGKISWSALVPDCRFTDPGNGVCSVITPKGKTYNFQILSDDELKASSEYFTLAGRWTNPLLKRMDFSVNRDKAVFVTVLDPWNTGARAVLTGKDGRYDIQIKGKGFTDNWVWDAPGSAKTPSLLTGKRAGKLILELTGKDAIKKR